MIKSTLTSVLFLYSVLSYCQKTLVQSAWKNRTDYLINVSLNDVAHTLDGYMEITYFNNSPDTLKEILIHQWPNAYRNKFTPLAKQLVNSGKINFHFAPDSSLGWLDSTLYAVDGSNVQVTGARKLDPLKNNGRASGEIITLQLKQPLRPGNKIVISTPFTVHIPGVFSRMGHEKGFYAITQWYPKPAVYDANGWHPMPYLDQGEFYSEFGRFDVNINVPREYTVAATGVEVQPEGPNFQGMTEFKQYRFVQDSIHDFAWFTSKNLKEIYKDITLPSGKMVRCYFYSESEPDMTQAEYVARAVKFYSGQVGEYPYSVCKAVVGPLKAGGGMEYPTITIVDSPDERVILHEVGHNWFYGILASDERQYPWMDEGVNSHFEQLYYTKRKAERDSVSENIISSDKYKFISLVRDPESKPTTDLMYRKMAGEWFDLPAGRPSEEHTALTYGGVVYGKTALLFDYLRAYLGEKTFMDCIHKYYSMYAFRHPLPGDIKRVFEETAGKDLTWFFDGLINSYGSPDLAIRHVKKLNDTTVHITVSNEGIQVPYPVQMIGKDGLVLREQWFEPGSDAVMTMPAGTQRIVIDAREIMPETGRANNYYFPQQAFKKYNKIQVKPGFGPEDPARNRIFILPAIGWNEYNNWMFGIAAFNSVIPRKRLEFSVAPLYSFSEKAFSGTGNVQMNAFPFKRNQGLGKYFTKVELGYSVSSFRMEFFGDKIDYIRHAPYMNLRYNKKKPGYGNFLQFRFTGLDFKVPKGETTGPFPFSLFPVKSFADITSYTENDNALRPSTSMVRLQYGHADRKRSFLKLSGEIEQRFRFKGKKKYFDLRLFAGTFLDPKSSVSGEYRYRLGGMNGLFDYTFDNLMFGRLETKGLLSQQILGRDAFFKTTATFGESYKWMTAVNLKSSLPGIIPFRLFADLGAYYDQLEDKPLLRYNAGALVELVHGALEVYFPIIQSDAITKYYELNYETKDRINYYKRISFIFKMEKFQPLKQIRELKGL